MTKLPDLPKLLKLKLRRLSKLARMSILRKMPRVKIAETSDIVEFA